MAINVQDPLSRALVSNAKALPNTYFVVAILSALFGQDFAKGLGLLGSLTIQEVLYFMMYMLIKKIQPRVLGQLQPGACSMDGAFAAKDLVNFKPGQAIYKHMAGFDYGMHITAFFAAYMITHRALAGLTSPAAIVQMVVLALLVVTVFVVRSQIPGISLTFGCGSWKQLALPLVMGGGFGVLLAYSMYGIDERMVFFKEKECTYGSIAKGTTRNGDATDSDEACVGGNCTIAPPA